MSMVKVIPPDSYDFGEPRVQLIKIASSGLRGNDLKQLIKRAGFNFADIIRHAQLKPGDIPVHIIALGATEHYGPNRNGDGFKEATCRKCHNSFVKYARWYHNHQNKDPDKSYGHIKHSEFNETMKRIELLAVLNGTKEAADRNGGLVADEELKTLNEDKDIPTSMACKVAYDICAGCGNRARNRSEYCTGEDEGGMCKRGGVKNRMTMVHEDGFQNHVENPDPLYFDMSKVFRGADRISWANGIVKSASALVLGGAALAEQLGLDIPPLLSNEQLLWPTRIERLVTKLASLENDCEKQAAMPYDLTFSVQEPTLWNDHGSSKYQALAALFMYKIAMPVDGFIELVTDKEAGDSSAMIRRCLPGVYTRLLNANSVTETNLRPFMPCGAVNPVLMKWAAAKADDYSLARDYVEKRNRRAALYGVSVPTIKTASKIKISGNADLLAKQYALYKLALLQALSDTDQDFDLSCQMVVRQNYVN